MNWGAVLTYLPAAVTLSIVAYLVRFFGKAIADQVPFADDRDWQIELNGLWFFTDLLLPPGLIAVAALLYFRMPIFVFLSSINQWLNPISYHWVNLAVVFIIIFYYAIAATILSEGKYQLTALVPQTAWGGSEMPEEQRKRIFNRTMDVNAAVLQISVLILAFIGGIEMFSNSMLWITVFAVQIFTALIGLALNYSLMKYHFPVVNVLFLDNEQLLSGVTLLKVNKDNIRVRDNDRVRVVNKNLISQWEVVDADQEKGTQRSLSSVTRQIPWLLMVYAFWKHQWVIGLLVGFVAPSVFAALAAWLLKVPKLMKLAWMQAIEDMKTDDGKLWEKMKVWPLSLKIAIPIWFLGIIPTVLGLYGAWQHNIFFAILYGVVTPFFISLLCEIIIFPQIVEIAREKKSVDISPDGEASQ